MNTLLPGGGKQPLPASQQAQREALVVMPVQLQMGVPAPAPVHTPALAPASGQQAPVQPVAPTPLLWCWRHPRARGAAGRCIGRTDLPVDPRKAKRLAHRLRQTARRHGLRHAVWVSPLQRSRSVGVWLRRWGWRVQVDARLAELDFGAWDGLAWEQIAWAEVLAWQADLLHHAPGGGETLLQLAARVASFLAACAVPAAAETVADANANADADADADADAGVGVGAGAGAHTEAADARLLVTHGGWLNALLHVRPGAQALAAADWPAAPRHGSLTCWAPAIGR